MIFLAFTDDLQLVAVTDENGEPADHRIVALQSAIATSDQDEVPGVFVGLVPGSFQEDGPAENS